MRRGQLVLLIALAVELVSCGGSKDGDTPTALVAVARERKDQAKTGLPGSVLWFPQEIAH